MVRKFTFRNLPVGYFEESAFPRVNGRYRYMPYRGPGHYELGRALAEGPARCAFNDKGATVEFIVRSIPEYGVLLIEFPDAAGLGG